MPEGSAGATVRVTATALVRAPHARVWAVLTDFPAMHRWFLGVRAVRLEGPACVGALRLVTLVGGSIHRETISAWSPPSHLALVAADASGLIAPGARVDIRLAEAGGGIRLEWSIEFRLSLGRAAAALSRPPVRVAVGTALRLSLGRLRRLAEARNRN